MRDLFSAGPRTLGAWCMKHALPALILESWGPSSRNQLCCWNKPCPINLLSHIHTHCALKSKHRRWDSWTVFPSLIQLSDLCSQLSELAMTELVLTEVLLLSNCILYFMSCILATTIPMHESNR